MTTQESSKSFKERKREMMRKDQKHSNKQWQHEKLMQQQKEKKHGTHIS